MVEMAGDQKSEPVSFVEMKASVGSLLFLWSSIERELAKRIETLENGANRIGAHTTAQKIAQWEKLAECCQYRAPRTSETAAGSA